MSRPISFRYIVGAGPILRIVPIPKGRAYIRNIKITVQSDVYNTIVGAVTLIWIGSVNVGSDCFYERLLAA